MSDQPPPAIKIRENAFVRLENVPVLKNSDGTSFDIRPVMALCRCGQSANKPFCDGAHKRNNFVAEKSTSDSRDKVFTYAGAEIDVHYAKLLCSHAGECAARLKAVFDPSKKPWVQPEHGAKDDILAVVKACPSGALSYSLKGEANQHIGPDDAAVIVEKNGPYRVQNVPLDGEKISVNGTGQKYVLCRCGLSSNKPFCDGTHHDLGWSDEA